MEISPGISAAASPAQPRQADEDVPSIIAPGPWIAFGALAFGIAFDSLHVFKVLGHVPALIRNSAALLLFALGAWYILRANVVFRREQTPFQPWRPTRIVAAQDIYAHTRNPMYQGFLIVVLGLAVLFRSDWTVLLLMPATMLIHYGVVLREERYLERRFGEGYRRYQAAVPRYGWPFASFFK
jgi:protein-S-isoprenylcysteine O-methyltransferase Ste14